MNAQEMIEWVLSCGRNDLERLILAGILLYVAVGIFAIGVAFLGTSTRSRAKKIARTFFLELPWKFVQWVIGLILAVPLAIFGFEPPKKKNRKKSSDH